MINTRELIQRMPVTQEIRDLLLTAVAKSGPNEGYLTLDPSSESRKNGAWDALMLSLCPNRVSISRIIANNIGATEGWAPLGFVDIDIALESVPHLALALSVTEPALRWNLVSMQYDRVRVQATILKMWAAQAGGIVESAKGVQQ